MAELYPAPLENLLKRIYYERQHGQIFDLPIAKFYRGRPDLDTSVSFHSRRAANPVGPAAGPQDQMVQNIVLSWLAGSRIIELKTVQIIDDLKIPRPCIDATNVGYNVEWSQELKLEQSLSEYVSASMILEILRAESYLGLDDSQSDKLDTIFDMSVGYDLKGIQTERVRNWIESMKDATSIIDEMRPHIPDEFSKYRDWPFNPRISDTITLSTFHGCPADEIERIVHFLLTEMGVHMIIKMNPTLLTKPVVDHLLHDVLGYTEIATRQEFFDNDLQFLQALEIVARLGATAGGLGKELGVKFSNTLVVSNHKTFFSDETMYLSGAPLHVITLNLVEKFRSAVGPALPISFSAGVDAQNFANCVAMNFVPVTTCTDLLRPGGYARLPKYLENLEAKMLSLGVGNIKDFVVKSEGHGETAINRAVAGVRAKLTDYRSELGPRLFGRLQVAADQFGLALKTNLNAGQTYLSRCAAKEVGDTQYLLDAVENEDLRQRVSELFAGIYDQSVKIAGGLNTTTIVDRTTKDPRYAAVKNRAVPRKIGSQLYLYDCINCDKCVPVCPNDANFVYEVDPVDITYTNYLLTKERVQRIDGGRFKVAKSHQLANFADFCNECGNCDVFCPEDGGPYIEKPRFFGTLEAFERHNNLDGCLILRDGQKDIVRGRIGAKEFVLTIDRESDSAVFSDSVLEIEMENSTGNVRRTTVLDNGKTNHILDMKNYHILDVFCRGALDRRRVNYINADRFPEVSSSKLIT